MGLQVFWPGFKHHRHALSHCQRNGNRLASLWWAEEGAAERSQGITSQVISLCQMASHFFPFLTQPEDSDSCGEEDGSAQLRPRTGKGGMSTKGVLMKDPAILPPVNSDCTTICIAQITLISWGWWHFLAQRTKQTISATGMKHSFKNIQFFNFYFYQYFYSKKLHLTEDHRHFLLGNNHQDKPQEPHEPWVDTVWSHRSVGPSRASHCRHPVYFVIMNKTHLPSPEYNLWQSRFIRATIVAMNMRATMRERMKTWSSEDGGILGSSIGPGRKKKHQNPIVW